MPRGVTEQDVFEAADALLARGERPTIERVRQELGSGSPNTINPHLDTWWAALGKRIGGVQAPGLPPALLQAFLRFYGELRDQAFAEAQVTLAEQRRLAEEAKQALESCKEEMATERLSLQTTIATLRGELTRLGDAGQALTRQVAQQQVDVNNASQKAAQAAEQLRRAQGEHERAIAASKAELDRIREQWQGNEKHWLGEIEHLREDAKRQRAEHDRLLKGHQGRVQDLEGQLSAASKERGTLQVSIDIATRDLAKERERRSFAEGALAASKQRGREGPAAALRRRRSRNAK